MTAVAAPPRERPILFGAPMVRAILDGSKTQTRRVVKPSRGATFDHCVVRTWDEEAEKLRAIAPEPPDIAPYLLGPRVNGQHMVFNLVNDVGIARALCPYGSPGDRLWVRESWCVGLPALPTGEGTVPWLGRIGPLGDALSTAGAPDAKIAYAATWDGPDRPPMRPSIHMPRWASRITLEITDVRVERLQAISEDDAKAEGVDGALDLMVALKNSLHGTDAQTTTYRGQFAALWDALNAKRGYSFESNPWVWVISFRRVAP